MRSVCFRPVFALFGAAILALPDSAHAQGGPALQQQTSFAAQYDTALGWRPTYGTPSVHNRLAEPTIAAGPVDGGTRLLLGANNSIGNFFNALQGPDQVNNAQQDLASVFGGFLPADYYITQPQVLRDSSPLQLPGLTGTADRYVIVARATNTSTHDGRIYISATQYTSVSVYSQCLFWFNVNDSSDNSLWPDSLRVGTSANTLLVTANMYSYSDNSFQYAKLWVVPKTSIYNDPSAGTCPAAPPVPANLVLNMPNSDGSLPFSVAPARSYDNRPIAYMVNSSTNGGNSLTLWTLDTTDPTVITGTYGPVSTNSYSMPPNAQQAGTSALITTWDPRIFNAVYQPDSGLWTAHTTGCTPAGDTTERACVQWYQMDPASFTVQQQGLVQLPGWYFYSAAIAANDEGDAVLGFTGSNANQYAGIYLTGRYHTDPPNTVQTILQVKAGEGCYQTNDGLNSVSTHSDATVDPIDSTVFWTHTAFAYGKDASCQNNDWATGIAAVQFVGGTAVSNGATSSSKANGTLARPRRRLQVLSHFGG